MTAPDWRLPDAADGPTTYLAHARALTAQHGTGPWPAGGAPLPDAQPPDRRPFISDAVMDGILTSHVVDHEPDDGGAAGLAARIAALTRRSPTAGAVAALHEAAAGLSPLQVADALGRELVRLRPDAGRVHAIGHRLAEHGTRKSAVAIGLVLLGLTGAGDDGDRELLLTLGALEDLTLYAATAVQRSGHGERTLYELGRRVDGWGRIHVVRRLAGTADPEIRGWLLREGYRNTILDEYLAHLAATTGDLAGALAAEAIDDELLDGAGGILLALCRGGPSLDLSDYDDGPAAIRSYLRHAGHREPSLPRIAIVATLRNRIGQDDIDWPQRERDELREMCTGLTARPDWRAAVDDALASDDPAVNDPAIRAATALELPIGARLRQLVCIDRYDIRLWFVLVDLPVEDFARTVELAEALLPLGELATGPGLEVGCFGGDDPAAVLDVVVSRLDRVPGLGWPLIRAALANATIRNRYMAVQALGAWPGGLTPAARSAVEAALAAEPDDDLRKHLHGLLGED